PRRGHGYNREPTEELADEDLESFELPDEAEETAGTVMNAEVFHVPTSATLEEIARKMTTHKIHRVLVTDPEKGHVVGIISTMGILAAISA
ncbi:MAG: CBS domain-containing protein, partial [Planctomycetes bacterium]|nr:CBS domain-containing protein [Planctomycetota bacterium]